ncbi:MAG: hypothetical protein ABSC94_04315 [Polyangiaceae bacterium]
MRWTPRAFTVNHPADADRGFDRSLGNHAAHNKSADAAAARAAACHGAAVSPMAAATRLIAASFVVKEQSLAMPSPSGRRNVSGAIRDIRMNFHNWHLERCKVPFLGLPPACRLSLLDGGDETSYEVERSSPMRLIRWFAALTGTGAIGIGSLSGCNSNDSDPTTSPPVGSRTDDRTADGARPFDGSLASPVDAGPDSETDLCQACLESAFVCDNEFQACSADCTCTAFIVSLAQCVTAGSLPTDCLLSPATTDDTTGRLLDCCAGPCGWGGG